VNLAWQSIWEAHFRRFNLLECAIKSNVITASMGKMEFSS
jgi:hypothetical protein